MSINESILQRTKNYFRCVGTLYKTNLKREVCDIKITNENGQSEKVEGERINGGFTVRTANGIHTFNVYGTSTSKFFSVIQEREVPCKNAYSFFQINLMDIIESSEIDMWHSIQLVRYIRLTIIQITKII